MKRVVIVGAKRTPFGRFRGALADWSPVELAVCAGNMVLAGLDRARIDQVILGNVLSAGHGMNVARQVAIKLGLPVGTPASTVNMMCGSGMQSALMAVSVIRAGEANAVLVGGTESMSQSPMLMKRPAKGELPDAAAATDSLLRDGLVDSFSQRHMGEQAEELAAEFTIARDTQDAFAARSQHLFAAALARGDLADEVIAVGDLAVDQHPRPDVTRAELASLRPVFQRPGILGTVTAGNASGINDGAVILLLAEQAFAAAHGWPVLAEWIDGVVVGCDPARMGLGPVHAIAALFRRTGRDWASIDTLEINEAFAAQTLACLQVLKLSWDETTEAPTVTTPGGRGLYFNRDGGAIALGHPLAASGARLLAHLAWSIARGRSSAAIGALCIGGGMGIAALLTPPEIKTTRKTFPAG